jgi:hypothetical protein
MGRELYLHVPQDRAAYWQKLDILTDLTKEKFPGATLELRSESDCYALSMSTACVFHCMRSLEYGLTALARNVGLTWTKEQWHSIIELVESKIGGSARRCPEVRIRTSA